MIFLSDPQSGTRQSFNNHAELCRHFNQRAQLESCSGKPQGAWKFIFFPYRHLAILEQHVSSSTLTPIERQAIQQQLDLVEVHQGDDFVPQQIPLTADIDILGLKREWCRAYAKKADLMIFESELAEP